MTIAFRSLARWMMLSMVMGLGAACVTTNGSGNGSGGSSSSNGPTTVCERSTTGTLCTCSTYAGNSGTTSGFTCATTCDDLIATDSHCCLLPEKSVSTSIAFCACSDAVCKAGETTVADCRAASGNQAVAEGMGNPTFAACN